MLSFHQDHSGKADSRLDSKNSSWQKGGVENANKMIRRYIPKGTDLAVISQEYLDHVVCVINRKPRRSSHYRTAPEAVTAGGIIQSTGVRIEG